MTGCFVTRCPHCGSRQYVSPGCTLCMHCYRRIREFEPSEAWLALEKWRLLSLAAYPSNRRADGHRQADMDYYGRGHEW